MHHGILTPFTSPKPTPGRIPRSLQSGVIELQSGWMDHERSIERYGLWEIVALNSFSYRGHHLEKGDRAKLPGNVAWVLSRHRDADFVDARMDEEDAAAAEVARLAIPLSARDNPAFAAPRREFANAGMSDK